MTFWRWLISLLVWLSAEPQAFDLEHAKAAAAVSAARASMIVDAPAPPGPAPTECDCGRTCVRGKWKPDGRVEQICKCACPRCVAERSKGSAECKDGSCQVQRVGDRVLSSP
jgi:hypothetical protein